MMMRKDNSERAFEAAMEAWAKTDFGDDAAIGRIIAKTEQLAKIEPPQTLSAPARHGWRKLVFGVGIAASAVVAMLAVPGTDPKTGMKQEVSFIEVEADGLDSEDTVDSFALLYTPTMEEELYI